MSFLANWWYRKEKPIWSGIGGDFGFSRYTASTSDSPGGKGIEASGGTEYMWTDPGPGNKYKSHVFTGSGSWVVSNKSSNPAYPNHIEYLVVGGGGGAGMYTGGGGGAGGCLGNLPSSCYDNQSQGQNTVATEGTVTVTIGGGGSGNTDAWYSEDNTNGGDSSMTGPIIDNITANGGGRGGNYWSPTGPTNLPYTYGKDGGSGGGGSRSSFNGPAPDRYGVGNNPTAWSPIPQGNNGGGGHLSSPGQGGGGGGGWGGAGQASGPPGSTAGETYAGSGGVGRKAPAETWGPNLAVGGPGPGDPAPQKGWFGGGGGGGAEVHPGSTGTGGQGGGAGAPDTGWAGGGNGGSQNEGSPDAARTAGGTNTGGGGGAGDGGAPVQQQSGANGGSGIVMIRYEIAPDMPTSPFAP